MQAEGGQEELPGALEALRAPMLVCVPKAREEAQVGQVGSRFFFLSQKECMGPLEVGGCPDYHHFASCPVWEGSEGLESLLGVPVCCPRPSLHAALHPRMQMNSDPSWFQLSDTVILV